MLLYLKHPTGTNVVVDSTDFPLITCKCERCGVTLVADERGPEAQTFITACDLAIQGHRCKGLD